MPKENPKKGENRLLEDLSGDRPRVEIMGCDRVMVENHKGIMEYDERIIRLKCKGCEVCIKGANLDLSALTLHEICITGIIVSVEYRTGG